MGAAATLARRDLTSANVNTSSFGSNTRQAKAILRQTYLKVLEKKAKDILDAESDTVAVYQPANSRAHSVSMTLHRVESDKTLTKSVLRSQDFQLAALRALRACDKEDEEFAANWRKTVGADMVNKFVEIAPLFFLFRHQMNLLPDRSTNVYTFAADLASAKHVCMEVCIQSRYNNMFSTLNADWASRCKPILFNECTPIPDAEAKPKKYTPSCRDLRMCKCTPSGTSAMVFTNRARAATKQTFPRWLG